MSALLAAAPNPEARLLILAQCAQSVYSGAAHLLCGCPRLFYDVASQIGGALCLKVAETTITVRIR